MKIMLHSMRTHCCHSVCMCKCRLVHSWCAFNVHLCVLAYSSLFLPSIDNANLSFSSLIFCPPSLCALSTVAVKSSQWVFVQHAQRSFSNCWVELAESLPLPGSQQTIVNWLKRVWRAFEAFEGCVKGKSNVGWIHSQSHSQPDWS